jgi:hypothetical protein
MENEKITNSLNNEILKSRAQNIVKKPEITKANKRLCVSPLWGIILDDLKIKEIGTSISGNRATRIARLRSILLFRKEVPVFIDSLTITPAQAWAKIDDIVQLQIFKKDHEYSLKR